MLWKLQVLLNYLSLKLSLGQPPTHGTMVSGALEAVITI